MGSLIHNPYIRTAANQCEVRSRYSGKHVSNRFLFYRRSLWWKVNWIFFRTVCSETAFVCLRPRRHNGSTNIKWKEFSERICKISVLSAAFVYVSVEHLYDVYFFVDISRVLYDADVIAPFGNVKVFCFIVKYFLKVSI